MLLPVLAALALLTADPGLPDPVQTDPAWGPVMARHVRMDRWRFDPIRHEGELLAIVAWWDRAEGPDLGDTGGNAHPALLYVLADNAEPLGLPALDNAGDHRPLALAWPHDAQWAYALLPAVMLMGQQHATLYTDIPTGWYINPEAQEREPTVTPFPSPADPLLTAHAGDAAKARAALDDLVAFLANTSPEPTERPTADRFDALPADFIEIFGVQPWTLIDRAEPEGGVCTCTYGKPRPSLAWRTITPGPGPEDRRAINFARTQTELHEREVLADAPCPDEADIEAMIAEDARLERARSGRPRP